MYFVITRDFISFHDLMFVHNNTKIGEIIHTHTHTHTSLKPLILFRKSIYRSNLSVSLIDMAQCSYNHMIQHLNRKECKNAYISLFLRTYKSITPFPDSFITSLLQKCQSANI